MMANYRMVPRYRVTRTAVFSPYSFNYTDIYTEQWIIKNNNNNARLDHRVPFKSFTKYPPIKDELCRKRKLLVSWAFLRTCPPLATRKLSPVLRFLNAALIIALFCNWGSALLMNIHVQINLLKNKLYTKLCKL